MHAPSELMQAAREAATKAYAPYSHFRVGAAVRTAGGATYLGANVENASFGLTICAERAALAAAISAGERDFMELAISCVDAPEKAGLSELVPCGACRQWIQELAPSAVIHIDRVEREFCIGDFLPNAFALPKAAVVTPGDGAKI